MQNVSEYMLELALCLVITFIQEIIIYLLGLSKSLHACEMCHDHYVLARWIIIITYLCGGSQDIKTPQSRLSRMASKSVVSVSGSTSIADTTSCVAL